MEHMVAALRTSPNHTKCITPPYKFTHPGHWTAVPTILQLFIQSIDILEGSATRTTLFPALPTRYQDKLAAQVLRTTYQFWNFEPDHFGTS